MRAGQVAQVGRARQGEPCHAPTVWQRRSVARFYLPDLPGPPALPAL